MTSRLCLLLALSLLCTGVLLADDFSGYRIPTHSLFSVSGQAYGSYSHRGTHSEYGRDWEDDWAGSLSGYGLYLRESDPLRLKATLDGSASGSYHAEKSYITKQAYWPPFDRGAKNKSLTEYFGAAVEGWAYPFSVPFGIYSSMKGRAGYRQAWATSYYHDHQPTISQDVHYEQSSWTYQYSLSGDAGFGIGRVRDATSVYDVIVLEQRLRERGVLNGSLSPETRQKLADHYYKRSDYSAVHERGDKYFWEELERILREDSGLRGSVLDAYTLYRVAESIDGQSFVRERGFFVGPIVSVSHTHDIMKESGKQHSIVVDSAGTKEINYSESRRRDYFSDYLEIGGKGEYHFPLGERWQIDVSSSVVAPLNNSPHAIKVNNSLYAEYVVADRWRALFSFRQNRAIFESKYRYDSYKEETNDWLVGFEGGLRYFVEDHMSLDLLLEHRQSRGYSYQNYIGGSHNSVFARNTDIRFGMTYLFAGAFGAQRGSSLPASGGSKPPR